MYIQFLSVKILIEKMKSCIHKNGRNALLRSFKIEHFLTFQNIRFSKTILRLYQM